MNIVVILLENISIIFVESLTFILSFHLFIHSFVHSFIHFYVFV